MARKTFAELNFPDPAQAKLDALVQDENWTWSGLAHALKRKFGKEDLEELIYCLKKERP